MEIYKQIKKYVIYLNKMGNRIFNGTKIQKILEIKKYANAVQEKCGPLHTRGQRKVEGTA